MSMQLWTNQCLARVTRDAVLLTSFLSAVCALACEPVANLPENNHEPTVQRDTHQAPTIEAAPITKGDDQWQVITSDNITLTVTAPGAQSTKILYRPSFAEDRHVELRQLNAPSDS